MGRVKAVHVVLAVALSVVAGCASQGHGWDLGSRYADASGGSVASTVRHVLVLNNSWNRITVYIRSEAGAQIRLGDVESMNREVFPVKEMADDGNVTTFVAHPLAGQSFTSEQFMFPDGSTAVWTVENHAALSSVKVR